MSLSTSAWSKITIITAFVASVGDFVITFLIGLHYENYNFLTDSQSDLGTWESPVAIYMNSWEIILGVLVLICAICLYKTGFFKTRLEKVAVYLLAIYGLGEGIGSGFFPFNHVQHHLTTVGWLHSIFSGIGITAMVVLSFVLVKIFPKNVSTGSNKLFVSFAITGMIFIILCLLSRKDFLAFIGLWQRLYLLDYYFMLITLTFIVSRNVNENSMN
jgi:hypothetical membrane protein